MLLILCLLFDTSASGYWENNTTILFDIMYHFLNN